MKREMNEIDPSLPKFLGRARSPIVPFAILAMWPMYAACPGFAQEPGLPGFQSPAEASRILFQAVQRGDAAAVAMILGGPSELASSGDAARDKLDRDMFVRKYQEMHRLGRDADGSETLYIGAENWPFPIPLVQIDGAWHFDPVAGLKEVLFRRIGENELTAIAICHELVAAEKQFRANPKVARQADNPLASLVSAAARGSDSAEPLLIHGYYFGIATNGRPDGKAAGGFGFVAYPAEYRSSGVMTFFITANALIVASSTAPTVAQKYPRAHICWPQCTAPVSPVPVLAAKRAADEYGQAIPTPARSRPLALHRSAVSGRAPALRFSRAVPSSGTLCTRSCGTSGRTPRARFACIPPFLLFSRTGTGCSKLTG